MSQKGSEIFPQEGEAISQPVATQLKMSEEGGREVLRGCAGTNAR